MRVWMVLALLLLSSRVAAYRPRSMRPLWGSTSGLKRLASTSTSQLDNLVDSKDGERDLVGIKVTQRKYKVDEDAVRLHIKSISDVLGVGDFQVDVWYCSENKIRELNGDWRGKRKSTDVLSFPANEFIKPGEFDYDADPTMQYMKHLGDIVVAPAYVQRQCERDKSYYEQDGSYDDDEDAGVSKAMAREFELDKRIDLLLVHSMVHLLGYDHESPGEWKEMTAKEEQVLAALEKDDAASIGLGERFSSRESTHQLGGNA